jgi:8-oxo-dGTP diphosphatase
MSNSSHPPAVGEAASAAAPVRRGAKAVVSSPSRVLLVRERHSDGRPFWTLPGGGVETGESLVDGLRRELAEELRCDPVVGDALSTFWYAHLGSPRTLSRYTAFSCSIPGDVRPARSEGILDSAWFAPDELPARTLPQVRFLLRDDAHHPAVPSPTR